MSKGNTLTQKQLDLLDFNFYIEKFNKTHHTAHSSSLSVEGDSTVAFDIQQTDPNFFTPVENLLLQYTLRHAVKELNILNNGCARRFVNLSKEVWGGRVPLKQNIETGELREMREKIVYMPTIQCMKDGMMTFLYTKIASDVDWCANVLHHTQTELQRTGCYEALKKTVAADREDELEEYELIKNYTKHKHYLEYLEKKHAELKQKSDVLLNELDNEILGLENEIHDTQLESAIKTRLICKWEKTRFEQGAMMLDKTKEQLKLEMNRAHERLDIEKRAINEIESFLSYEIDKIDEKTDYWQNKYDTEIEKLDDAINMANENITELQRKYEDMKELYEARSREMDDYWTKKKLEAEAIALAEKKWNCAIKIQAWWRGTMVRRHLGPYKKKKKGKGGKGGKGKKK